MEKSGTLMGLSNLSIGENSDSGDSFSFSTLSTKFNGNLKSNMKSNNDSLYVRERASRPSKPASYSHPTKPASYSHPTKVVKEDQPLTSRSRHRRLQKSKAHSQHAHSKQHKRADGMAATIHAFSSDSDFKGSSSKHKRRSRPGLDRQRSISRWMADTGVKLRKAVSSHGSLSGLSSHSRRSRRSKSPSQRLAGRRNAPFRLFKRGDSSASMPKPVRKRSFGPDSLIKDVLAALSNHGDRSSHNRSNHDSGISSLSHHSRSGRRSRFFGSRHAEVEMTPDADDIEEDTDNEDDDLDLMDDMEEFHGDGIPTPLTECSGLSSKEFAAPLLNDSYRWNPSPTRNNNSNSNSSTSSNSNAGSSCQKSQESDNIPPLDRVISHSRSSKTMPVPPPPPFSPSPPRPSVRNHIDVVPNDFFQPNIVTKRKEDESPCKPMRVNPLVAATAAIAIATDSMSGSSKDDYEETNDSVDMEESVSDLNDLMPPRVPPLGWWNGPRPKHKHGEQSSNDGGKTDAATADSSCDSWSGDCSISLDGVSLLSASNASMMFHSTYRGGSVSSLGTNTYTNTISTLGTNTYTNTISTASNMNKFPRQEPIEEDRNNESSSSVLGQFFDKVKREQVGDRKNVKSNTTSRLDVSCKSFAEETFELNSISKNRNDSKSPRAIMNADPAPILPSSDHHPALLLSRREKNSSIVPPTMPRRMVSNHNKSSLPSSTQRRSSLDSQTTQKTTPSMNRNLLRSPSDRVQRLVELNQRKYNPSCTGRRCSLQDNHRRNSMDYITSEAKEAPRRASMDSAICTGSAFLTPTMSKTPRTSPSLNASRKRQDTMDSPSTLRTPISKNSVKQTTKSPPSIPEDYPMARPALASLDSLRRNASNDSLPL